MDTAASKVSLDTVKLLRQLQEYEITLKEARILHGPVAPLEAIDECIRSLRAKLNVDILGRYDRLSTTGPAVVVVRHGMCMGCHMQIPVGDLNRVNANKAEPSCPNCGRYIIPT